MKKKLSVITALVILVIMLGACGADPRSQFVNQMKKMSETNNNAGSFEMGVVDLELAQTTSGDAANQAMMGMVMSSIKDIKLTGDYLTDAKNPNNFETTINLSLMGTDIPLNMVGSIGSEPKIYMATDVMSSVLEVVKAFGSSKVPDITGLDELKGKYIDLMAMQEAEDKKASKAELEDMKIAQEFGKAYQKEVAKYISGLDKKSFTKKDDVITHTFTKKELVKMIELTDKVAKSDKKFSDFNVDEEAKIDEVFDEFSEFSITVKANAKSNATKMRMVMRPSNDSSVSEGFKLLSFDMTITSKSSKETVKMPNKKDILSENEMKELMAQSGTVVTLTDDQFKELIEEAKVTKGDYDDEKKGQLLAIYQEVLTEAQYKELEAALK